MKRVNFDYGNTCPIIDEEIRNAKNEIENFMDDLISDACGLIEKKQRQELAQEYANSLYKLIENVFETVRSTNEDMRDAADLQISDLKKEIADLESRIKQFE